MARPLPPLLGLLLPAAALSNGYDVPNVNPRDLAMAGALIAAQETAAAAFANPAALARVKGLSLDLAGNILDIRTTWNDPTGAFQTDHTQTDVHPAPPPSLSASYGFKLGDRGVGFGLSMTIPGGGNVFWPSGSASADPYADTWPGRYRIITVDRKVYGFYASGGIEVLKQLRLGAGLVYYQTTEDLTQAFTPLYPNLTARLGASGGALSYTLSAEATPFEDVPLALGILYRHKGDQTLKGDVHFSNVPPALAALAQDQGVTHALTYPNLLGLGLAYRVVPALLVAAGYTFNRYVVYDKDEFVGDLGTVPPIVVPRHYGNGSTYRLGIEWTATPRLKLRGGVLRDITGMPKVAGAGALVSPTYSPTLPDSDTWAGSLGLAYAFTPDLAVQGAVFHAWMDDVSSTNTDATRAYDTSLPFPGLYQTHVWIYGAGIVWHWDPKRAAGR